ncbi:MAG TPA: hypothetical protein VN634_17150 [Candidatus Limnocylindrales bacterium]|nr:hypothetical protein [Candidatus Limnocylindrales bacterium]
MKKLVTQLAIAATVGTCCGTASAQCVFGFDGSAPEDSRGPAPAKGIQGSMVRAFTSCGSTEYPNGNATTESGTYACQPITPPTAPPFSPDPTPYDFAATGKCTAKAKAALIKDCSTTTNAAGASLGLRSGPCHVTYVSGSCTGILRPDGVTPINGTLDDGWEFATLSRATFDDRDGGDMTVIDFPVAFSYSMPHDGKMEFDSSSAEALLPLVGPNGAAMPACTSIEFVDWKIKDPEGATFARLGGATVPR